jgi:adenylate cyclase
MNPSTLSIRLWQWCLRSLWQSRMIAILMAGLFFAVVQFFFAHSLTALNERSTDNLWQYTAQHDPERRVIIVDIDEASLARIGTWPWNRNVLAQLVSQLDQYKVGLKLFDVVFPETKQGDEVLFNALQAQHQIAPNVLAQLFSLRDSNPALGNATVQVGELAGALTNSCNTDYIPQALGYIGNRANLAATAGHITPRIDEDGAVRRIPALICYQQKTYPSLALSGLLALEGTAEKHTLSISAGTSWLDAPYKLSIPHLPGLTIPLDQTGNVRVPFGLAREAFISISAADVLEGRAPKHLLDGAWVIVGASAFGIGDAVPTAHGGAVSGLEVHAQLLTAVLDHRVPFSPLSAPLLQSVSAILAAGVLLLISHIRRRTVLFLPLSTGLFVLFFGIGHTWLLNSYHLWLGWTQPALFIIFTGSGLTLLEWTRSRLERERVYSNLSSYLSSPVAKQVALAEPNSNIEATRRQVTVLFADIRNFSSYCEGRPPEEAAEVLHRFFSTASTLIEAHQGVIVEMVGDSLMAAWNSLIPCEQHAEYALAISRTLYEQCSEQLPQTRNTHLEPLAIGIGIETGTALVGSFGAAHRRTHTLLGETVTIAHRLQKMTADLACPILVGEHLAKTVSLPDQTNNVSTLNAHSLPKLQNLGYYLLEGLRQEKAIYTLADLPMPNIKDLNTPDFNDEEWAA